RAAYGLYDPLLTLSASRNYVNQPGTFDPKKFTQFKPTPARPYTTNLVNQDSPYEQTVDSFGTAISGYLPMGLGYNLFARSDHYDATSFPIQDLLVPQILEMFFFPPATNAPSTNNFFGTVGFSVSQPLLKNFWIDQNRRDIQLEKRNVKISELVLKQ